MKRGVQLIAYANRLGGDLQGLRAVLEGPLSGVFEGVHVLPFFRRFDGADAGFDPEDHLEVDPRLGSWHDIAALAAGGVVMADIIVNHVSIGSAQFQSFVVDGDESAYAGMILAMGSVFPDGATEAQLARIYRPRPGLPFTPYVIGGRERRLIWTTFTDRQADIDVSHPTSVAYLTSILEQMAASGVTAVRLDAIGYAVKKAGTSCFMIPETFAFIRELSLKAKSLGMSVLVEVHSHYRTQVEISREIDYIYDFALPPLILHALFTSDVDPLLAWLDVRPTNVVSVLDTHDGIGVVDVGADSAGAGGAGLLDPSQIKALAEVIDVNTGGVSTQATGAAASNLDLYQVNSTFYDALGRDDERYLLARAVQFFLPGVPQVYYVGLLAGSNDVELLAATGVGRDVNRHHYTESEVHDALTRPVVQRLLAMIRFRNAHKAFDGEFSLARTGKGSITLEWRNGNDVATLYADFVLGTYRVVDVSSPIERVR
jgi:sucrose phosphorylase